MTSKEIVKQEIQITSQKKLLVTMSWCKACGICIELCPREVLGADEVTRMVILIAPESCNGCGLCELFCPDFAFAIEEHEEILT